MKNMQANSKRVFSLCLMATILLTGCKGNKNPPPTSAPTAQSSVTSTTSVPVSSSTSENLDFNQHKDPWTGTQITDPVNVQKFDQLLSRMVTNLQSKGIEVYDDSESSGVIIDNPGTSSSSKPETSSTPDSSSGSGDTALPGLPGLGGNTSSSSATSSSSDTTSSSSATTSGGDTLPGLTPSGDNSTPENPADKSDRYLELEELYPVYKHIFETDTGDDKVSFDRKMALVASYLNPEEKYSDEEIFAALRDSWYEEHTTWVPARWETLINANTSKDDFPLAPSGIYERDYLDSKLELLALLGIMFNCPSDAEIINAPKLNKWTIVSGTTTDGLYSTFDNKAREWGLEGRHIDKIINGMGTMKLPILPKLEYYHTSNPDEKADKAEHDIPFTVDKTDYFNFFYTFDKNGWATSSYKRQNALQITMWEFITKVSCNTTKDTPALAAYLKNNITEIYDEIVKIAADPTGNYTPAKFDAKALAELRASRWYKLELDYDKDELEEHPIIQNDKDACREVKWKSYKGYQSYLDSNFEASAATLQELITSYLGVNAPASDKDLKRTKIGNSAGSTDLGAYEYMTQGIETENGDPIAWTAFINYIREGMLEEDENGIALYKGAWKELNSIIKVEDASFESVFYNLQDDDQVAYSNYGVVFNSGIPATLNCNSAGGKGTFDWQLQWVFPEGRIKLSELKETLLDYIVLVGAFTENNYTNALDIALSGAINKTNSAGYAFGIDYVNGAAMLTIAKV